MGDARHPAVLLPTLFIALMALGPVVPACTPGDDDDSTENPGDDDSTGDPGDDDSADLQEIDLPACLDDPSCPFVFACGHRGATLFAPENTLLGFDVALSLGVEIVEIDVRPTADEVLVVMHDSTVDRTTDGSGEVDEMTLQEIRQLSVLSNFPDIDAQPVPTFVEALEHLRGRALVNVDAKTGRFDLIAADIAATDTGTWLYVQVDSVDEGLELRGLAPAVRLMPDVETTGDVEMVVDALSPELAEVPWNLDDPEVFAALAQASVRTNQNALGAADAAASVHEANGDDPCVAYRSIWERGATLIQTDAPHLLVPCLDELNAAAGVTYTAR